MPVKTSRADANGIITINHQQCKVCGLCVKVCPEGPLHIENRKLLVDYSRGLGCVACGHCAAICPHGCITVEGRDMTAADIVPLPPAGERASFEQLNALLLSRRSIRQYQKKEVPQELIDRILAAATTAPMGIPPSDVGVLVIKGTDKMQEFRRDMVTGLKGFVRVFSAPVLWMMRPFIGKEAFEMFRTFVVPCAKEFIEKDKQGVDYFTYDAPLGMLFYNSPFGDTTDPLIAATYAMIAAESLGLGSCMLGFPAPLLKQNGKLRTKYGLPKGCKPAMFIIFGYPALKFDKAIRRRFARVTEV
jgi:nitroreductase/Pyruvate/2-oxoacid:ferredoxin oxidoreductase delta subunit